MKNTPCILYIIFLILSSCTQEIPVSEIDFAHVGLNYDIAVDGFVCNEKERCRITLRKPVAISEKIEIIPIDDASVVLRHENETYAFQFDSNGVYYSNDSIIGIAGETYAIEINYQGNIYTAEEIMPDAPDEEFNLPFIYFPYYDANGKLVPWNVKFGNVVVPIHSFGYNKTNVWRINETRFMTLTLPLSELFYWRLVCIYTHQGSLPQGIFPPTNVFAGATGLATDSVEIMKAGISEQYEQYLRDKFNETEWQGKMFSTIPGNVSTNLSDGAIGYFYALNVKRKRFMLKDLVDLK